MSNKTVIITGANSGIGKESTIALSKMGAHVVLACRDTAFGKEQHANEVIADIKKQLPNASLSFIPLDLACFDSIRNFVIRFNQQHSQLDVLLNNAGVVSLEKRQTRDGFELTMATNHLGPFLLTNLLLPVLINTPKSRIVNVSSKAHAKGKITFSENRIKTRRPYMGLATYADSKLANIYFTQELAERLKGTDTTVNALHPGGVASNIWPDSNGIIGIIRRHIVKKLKTPAQGAQTSIYLCSSPDVEQVSGKYFYKKKLKQTCARAKDKATQHKLWQVSAECTQLNNEELKQPS
ncbi:SDR family oxidoreductase [Saccharobesus litoralis]|nr:SDR family oxidoreductase [Saccharobesus litoralis]